MSDGDKLRGYRSPFWDTQPPYVHVPYTSTQTRGPRQEPIPIPSTLSEVTGPSFAPDRLGPNDADLTAGHAGEPIGERIYVSGRVLDENGRPVPRTLVEIWQCNAAGRYLHAVDQHDAPLDPNFTGVGRVITDDDGRYKFKTIKPGHYPWRNHYNAWRPAHIHFSLFGPAFATRLVTQMYFPGDPMLEFDPIFNSVPDRNARYRLVSQFDWAVTESEYALGFHFDFVLRGRKQTPWEG
ncbi:MAG TPA: protocatechuate 3,4-dioxygenase subunit beta [Gammaproteobacteria bacterium]|nr:protocatechuate 3,4-dioxygenase subunit beta [Gammaproteobacteria bacterium]